MRLTPSGATLALPATGPSPRRRGAASACPRSAPAAPATRTATLVGLQWRGAQPHPRAMGLDRLPGKVNRYAGPDPKLWQCGNPLYAKVKYESVYPGIDLLCYGNQQQLEYDWQVSPGADPGRIRLSVSGARHLSLDAKGELLIETAGGTLCQRRPRLYQERAGRRIDVAGGYLLTGKNEVGFQVGVYDRSRPLIIDPTLAYSTFLGGGGADQGNAIAVDGAGNVYITGAADALTVWPTTRGAAQASAPTGGAFVTKLDLTKTGAAALVYSTYLGSGDPTNVQHEAGTGIAVDASGNVYVAGIATNPTLPITPGAFQPAFKGSQDIFAAKLTPAGTLGYCTYLGGSSSQEAGGIAVDPNGNALLVGDTVSSDFPTTANAFQRKLGSPGNTSVAVVKLDPTGKPVYSTYLGSAGEQLLGAGAAIATDAAGNAYVAGTTASPAFPTTADAVQKQYVPGLGGFPYTVAFVTKLSPAGAMLYSTLLGVDTNSYGTTGNGIAVDSAQNIYVTGSTYSAHFPVTVGAFQPKRGIVNNAFVTKISAAGGLAYSTYLGGNGGDQGNAIAVDPVGDAFVAGQTSSVDFPITPSAVRAMNVQPPGLGGTTKSDGFATLLDPSGKLLFFSTYLGGTGDDIANGIATDGQGGIYVVGTTDSPDFRTTPGAFQPQFGGDQNHENSILLSGDAFLVKISLQ